MPDNLKREGLNAFTPLPDMDDKQFGRWSRLVEKHTGMTLPPERKSFLVTNLGLRMREVGCETYNDYWKRLRSGVHGKLEWLTLIDRITVHETRFFRHPAALDLVRKHTSEKQLQGAGEAVAVQAWSVGCSTGEEAYTLGMVIDQTLRSQSVRSYFGIIASDISQPSLAIAREGVYREHRVGPLEPVLKRQYFDDYGPGRYQVAELLRKRICFATMNVLEHAQYPISKMDIIYCQNVLIYFDRKRRQEIVNGLAQYLLPGGILILGSGDIVGLDHPHLEKLDNSHVLAYRFCESPEAKQEL